MTDRERDDLLLSMANDIRDSKERLTTVDHRMGKVEHAVSHTLPIQIDSLENSLPDLRRDLEAHAVLPPQEATG